MPSEKTKADSLWTYLTGAATDGGAQSDPDASLGNYRSSSEAEPMEVTVTNPISGITIDYVSGGNELGDGSLTAVDSETLQWKCAGESYGAQVSIANGETKIVETLDLPGAYVRVTRTSASALSGTATLALARKLNNVFALDDVTSAEASAGDDEYRAVMVVNESAASVTNFKMYVGTLGSQQVSDTTQLGASGAGTIETTGSFAGWPENGWCHIKAGPSTREIVYYSQRNDTTLTVPAAGRARLGTSAAAGSATDTIQPVPPVAIGKDPTGVTSGGSAIQTIADEDTAPTSVTFDTGITAATGLDIGTMTAGQQIGIWIWREVPAGVVATADMVVIIESSFDAG